jgi:hypothetical protein
LKRIGRLALVPLLVISLSGCTDFGPTVSELLMRYRTTLLVVQSNPTAIDLAKLNQFESESVWPYVHPNMIWRLRLGIAVYVVGVEAAMQYKLRIHPWRTEWNRIEVLKFGHMSLSQDAREFESILNLLTAKSIGFEAAYNALLALQQRVELQASLNGGL